MNGVEIFVVPLEKNFKVAFIEVLAGGTIDVAFVEVRFEEVTLFEAGVGVGVGSSGVEVAFMRFKVSISGASCKTWPGDGIFGEKGKKDGVREMHCGGPLNAA